jgi:hypothetical protein
MIGDEWMERTWKEEAVAWSEGLYGHLPGWTE